MQLVMVAFTSFTKYEISELELACAFTMHIKNSETVNGERQEKRERERYRDEIAF